METYKLLFVLTLFLAVISTTTIGIYTSRTVEDIREDFNDRMDQNKQDYSNKINDVEKDFNSQLVALSSQLNITTKGLKNELDSRLETTQKELSQNINTLGSELTKVKEDSSSQIESLQKELLKIDIQSNDFTSIINSVIKAVTSVKTESSVGSGFIVDQSGYIVTNYHVINGKNSINVMTVDGNLHPARIVGFDSNVDIAVLKIDGSYDNMGFADSRNAQVGEKVIAMGSPAGLDFTITEGIISATNRILGSVRYIQTDVPINPGSSGGPLVNKEGLVVGVNTMKISNFEGIGFAVSSNNVKPVVENIINRDSS